MCLLPSPFCSLHAREHHISPHFGHVGKFEPRFPHVAHAVCTRNIDARSRLSSTGCSVAVADPESPLRGRGSAVAPCTGVGGPADEGAVGK